MWWSKRPLPARSRRRLYRPPPPGAVRSRGTSRRCRRSSQLRHGCRNGSHIGQLPLARAGRLVRPRGLPHLTWLAPMHILLIGSGGREHALAWKIAASPLVTKLWCAPGNAGIAREAKCVTLDIADHAAVIDFCRTNTVDFVVVGPETPLVAGIVDDLALAGIKAFGPSRAAAQLEGSKGFTKDLCKTNNIPTAGYELFTDAVAAKSYVLGQG